MALLTADNLSLAFGTHILLDKTNFSLEENERVSLIGRNGAGKTTLMRVILGEVQVDDGAIHHKDGLKIAYLAQEVPSELSGSVFDIVSGGAGEAEKLLTEYHHLIHAMSESSTPELMKKLERVQHDLESVDGWTLIQKVESVISRLLLNGDDLIENLSGGLKRRVMLARALVINPDILLLDEPTNHLDMESILWLEEFLKAYQGCVLLITHDRVFMQNVSTRILELDRGNLYSWEGDYYNYLRRKEEQLHAEEKANELFDKKLAEEEVWIRQGIKARRTRNEGRVRALEKMRKERQERRQQVGKVKMEVDDNLRSGKMVVELENISYSYENKPIVKNFSSLIMRGDRIGIIGPNGIGKSTLLNLLLGKLEPQKGAVRIGTKLEVAWFDQLRAQLDNEISVLENIGHGKEFVTINGKPRHVYSYLQDFLFTSERCRVQVKALSGGERNRLLLAHLFTSPANLLVLDEPTNDLDSETLELLESLLAEYKGTLIIVSHDRAFLNNVITSTLVFEETAIVNGALAYELNEYPGGYDDWLSQRKKQPVLGGQTTEANSIAKKDNKSSIQKKEPSKIKLSFKENRELETLPEKIEALENTQAELEAEIANPEFYQKQQDYIKQQLEALNQVQTDLENSYERWEELDQKQA